jgi:acylphosphatase
MVMYRDFAERKASRLGIVGTVRNVDDGTVEVIAEGPRDVLTAYIEKLKKGSLLSHVTAVEVEWRESMGAFKDFTILF